MKPLLLPPVVMALVRCPIVDYFTIVPICRYPEQLSGRATPTLPSWMPPAYPTLYGVPVLRSRTRTNAAANDIRHRYVSSRLLCFFSLLSISLYALLLVFILLKTKDVMVSFAETFFTLCRRRGGVRESWKNSTFHGDILCARQRSQS